MNDCSGIGLRTRMTLEYGELMEAQCFVRRRWEPSDEETRLGLLDFAKALGEVRVKSEDQKKVVRCLSDLCVAVRRSPDCLVAWPAGSAELIGPPYGKKVVSRIKKALTQKGLITTEQKSSKAEQLARIYKVDPSICRQDYNFKQHRDWHPVEVRSAKRKVGGKTFGGSPLGRRKFLGQIEQFEDQMYRINEAMATNPLCADDGRQFGGCRRIFNNGSLSCGGRLYGEWQALSEDERLLLKINGGAVCEIDIKACFVALAYSQFGNGVRPSDDPYSTVPFVAECKDPERRAVLRTVCKLLVVAYLGKEGELVQFPKGKKEKGEVKAIPFRKRYGLTKSVGHYMDQIKDAHPVLQLQKAHGDNLMFRESSIVVDSMMNLLDLMVVSYPVHDCLIVPLNQKDTAIRVLSDTMRNHLGFVPALDVAYYDQHGQKMEYTISGQGGMEPEGQQAGRKLIYDWSVLDDYELIEVI